MILTKLNLSRPNQLSMSNDYCLFCGLALCLGVFLFERHLKTKSSWKENYIMEPMGANMELYNSQIGHMAQFLTAIFLAFMCACSPVQKDNTFVSYKMEGSKLIVEVDTFAAYKYSLSVGAIVVDSGYLIARKEFDLSRVVKGNNTNRKIIALNAAKNDFTHEIKFQINDVLDTVFNYRQTITEIPDEKISFIGFGAPLVRKSKKLDCDKELRVWLYRRQEHLDDTLFDSFRTIYTELSITDDNEYVPVGNIPVVHDIDGRKYKVTSDIQADYYAIVACQNQAYINQFVEQAVGNNFTGLSPSLSVPLNCHYIKGTSGYRNVFLLGINKDWTYKQIPLATFALDNSAPESSFYDVSSRFTRTRYYYNIENTISKSEPSLLNYKDRIKVLYPSNKPKIFGGASVLITNWNGNGLECNVTFRVELSGDAKSVTIQRRGELCYYDKYLGYHFKPEDKVIYAKDHKGAYTFTYKMHFDDGDNIIPVIVEDYNGNKHKGSITVNAEFVRSDAPSINIDNNIDIYND